MSIILQALVILFVVLVTVLTAPLWLAVEAVLGLWRKLHRKESRVREQGRHAAFTGLMITDSYKSKLPDL